MPVTQIKPSEMGITLRQWRESAGWTIEELAARVMLRAPEVVRGSRELVRRYEYGAYDPKNASIAYLLVASEVLGHDARELGPDVAKAVDDLFEMAKPKPGPRDGQPAKAKSPRAPRSNGRSPDRYNQSFPGQQPFSMPEEVAA